MTFREVLRIPEFRAVWLAELLSVCGDQFARVALSVMVFQSTRSAALTALTYGLSYAPSLIGGILLTGIADRAPRRRVMVVVDLLRAGLILLVAIPGLPFWALCVLVGSVSLLNPVFKAAQLSLLPHVLSGDRFAVGMAIRSMTGQTAQLLGFAGGGFLLAVVTPSTALVLDAVTFAASALFVRIGVRHRPAASGEGDARVPRGWLAALRSGGRMAFADRGVRTLTLLIWLMAFLTVYEGLAAPYAAALGGDSTTVGLLLASDPLGGVVGAYLFGRWVPAHLRARLVGPLAVAAAALLLLCLFRPGLVASIAVFVVSGGLGTIVVMQATTFLAAAVPDASRGQLLGLSNTGLTAATGLSPVLAGVVAERIGAVPAVGWSGLVCLLLTLPLAVAWRRVLSHEPGRWD
ncbi:MFS transporter [Plantactinospora mayteni]|uniref:MFS transporter n=1 Tax=Plantactinospora mayteni TaxID=566021 RepID=A0ABQ4ETM2_9ACTN|nr:MFS transporter [Plantactinospora mayteni]GIG97969.1 MFS transporter [Plantactinospora mayteni]